MDIESVRPHEHNSPVFAYPGPLVYGTLTIGALLDAESTQTETYTETVAAVAVAMVLYWLAHSYATLMARRIEDGERLKLRAVAETAAHELSILVGALIPLLAVLISWLAGGTLTTAVLAAIWTSAAMIVLIELVAGVSAKLSGFALAVQTVFGVVLGIGIIAMKLIFH